MAGRQEFYDDFDDLTGDGSTAAKFVEQYGEKTLQVFGTFTATVTFEGTQDGTNWSPIAAAITAPGFITTTHVVQQVRATVSGHSAGTVSTRLGATNLRVAH